MNADALIAALRERGLIAPDAPPPLPAEGAERPWFVSLLMGLAGWVSGIFLLAFLALVLNVTSSGEMALIAVLLLGMAWALYAASRDFVFLDQLGLALSVAGQFALAFVFADKLGNWRDATAAILGLQLLLFAAMPDRTAKTLAVFAACVAWVFLVRFWVRPYEGGGAFLGADGHIAAPAFGAMALPIEGLLTWAPPIALVIWLRRTEPRWMGGRLASFARPAVTGLLLGIALAGICAEPTTLLLLGTDDIGRDINAWALFPLLSIALALFAAYTAFRLRSAALSGLSIVAALAHLARFYYLYGTTLTLKAMIMFAVGLVLLGAGRLLGRHAGETT